MQFKLIKNFKFQISNYKRGFTLIELIVVIAIVAVLSGVILFSVTQYINAGKDSNISANLAVLIPAGEVFYNGNNSSYIGFCNPDVNSVIKNALSQMPQNPTGDCLSGLTPGVCCNAESQAWAACATEFTNKTKAYCVGSRGQKEDMCNSFCNNSITQCPDETQCK